MAFQRTQWALIIGFYAKFGLRPLDRVLREWTEESMIWQLFRMRPVDVQPSL